MKTAIFKGAKTGALAGFVSSLTYAFIALIIIELFLPLGNSSTIVIFDKSFFSFIFPILIQTSVLWLLLPTIIGAITSAIFGFYFSKFKPARKQFVTRCTILCGLIALPVICLSLAEIIFATFFAGVYHPIISPTVDLSLLFVFPCIIYIVIGFATSSNLYATLSTLNDQTSPS